jgi:hypothetical protein
MRQEPETGERTLLAKEHLLRRYDEHVGHGHEAGLVIIGLRGADDDIRNAR